MNIKQKAREIIGEEVMPTDKKPITIDDFSTYNKGYNYAKRQILQKIDQIIDMAIAERDNDTESKLDEVWGILCEMDTNIKSEKEYAKDIINLIIHHQNR